MNRNRPAANHALLASKIRAVVSLAPRLVEVRQESGPHDRFHRDGLSGPPRTYCSPTRDQPFRELTARWGSSTDRRMSLLAETSAYARSISSPNAPPVMVLEGVCPRSTSHIHRLYRGVLRPSSNASAIFSTTYDRLRGRDLDSRMVLERVSAVAPRSRHNTGRPNAIASSKATGGPSRSVGSAKRSHSCISAKTSSRRGSSSDEARPRCPTFCRTASASSVCSVSPGPRDRELSAYVRVTSLRSRPNPSISRS